MLLSSYSSKFWDRPFIFPPKTTTAAAAAAPATARGTKPDTSKDMSKNNSSSNNNNNNNIAVQRPNIIATLSPIEFDDDPEYIYFEINAPQRLQKQEFQNLLQVFRTYKSQEIMNFDDGVKMWKTNASDLNESLMHDMRTNFERAGFVLNAFPKEYEDENVTEGQELDVPHHRYSRVVKNILLQKCLHPTVTVTLVDRAFLILTPTFHEGPYDKISWYDFLGQRRQRRPETKIFDDILLNDLSGVVDKVHRTIPNVVNVPKAIVPWVYMTYDVWLVDEFIKIAAQKVPNARVVLSPEAQKAFDDRFSEKEKRRKPIREVDDVRSDAVQLHPHQNEGIRFFQENNGRGLLADEMGLGEFTD
jgi:SNF2 family DNA or RNA helicase